MLEHIEIMNKKIADIREQYKHINFDIPGYTDEINCSSYNQINRDLHYKCIDESISYFFNQISGRYSILLSTGLGKSFSSMKKVCELIKQGVINVSDIILLGDNAYLSALDDIAREFPDLGSCVNELSSRYYTYQALAVNAMLDTSTDNIVSLGTNENLFDGVKFVIADECHKLAADKSAKVFKYIFDKYADCSFLFLSTIAYRYDDDAIITKDYVSNLLNAKVLYSMTRLDAYALGILLSPYHCRMKNASFMRDVMRDLEQSFNLNLGGKQVDLMTDDEVIEAYKGISSKHLVTTHVNLASKCIPFMDEVGLFNMDKHKISCLLLVDTIDSIEHKLNTVKKFFSDVASLKGMELVLNWNKYACNLSVEESRVNLINYDTQDSMNGNICCNDKSKLYVDILVGVHSVAQSIHPHSDFMFTECNIKANTKRQQSQGRLDSLGRKSRAIVIDFYNTYDLCLKRVVFPSGEDGCRGKSSPEYMYDIIGEPDFVYNLSNFELGNLSPKQLSNLSNLILSNKFNYTNQSTLDNVFSMIASEFNISTLTVKVILSNSGLLDIDFLSDEDAEKFFDSVILNKLVKVWGSYTVNDRMYTFSNGNTLLLDDLVIVNGVEFPTRRSELSVFNNKVLDSISCRKAFEEFANDILAIDM